MKTLIAILLLFAATIWGTDLPPITIVLSEDYSRTLNIRLNDHVILNKDVLDQLSNTIKDPKTPVIVFIPEQGRFADWMEIKGLLDKIGCLSVRYFVFSAKNRGMTELELPHDAIDFTLSPPPRSGKEGD